MLLSSDWFTALLTVVVIGYKLSNDFATKKCIMLTVPQVLRLWSTSIPVCVSIVTDPRMKESQT